MGRVNCHLVVDIGNSYIKVAVFEDGRAVWMSRQSEFSIEELKILGARFPIKAAIYASVRAENPDFIQHLNQEYHLIHMNTAMELPLDMLYRTPETLGVDRLAAAMGARALFPGRNVIVIDMGTCIKYDFVDHTGQYHGGNIAPGMQMRFESMHTMTGKLPLVGKKYNREILGKTTEEALQNGVVWGIKLEIEGFIKTLTDIWDNITVILSGGDSKYFGDIIESRIFVHPDLVLTGLDETLRFVKAKE